MIGVDTNVLVYAHREDSPHHAAALEALRSLTATGQTWCVPWPCVHEFLAIVTHPRIYTPPTDTAAAREAVTDLLALPGIVVVAESAGYAELLLAVLERSGVVGPKVHDARVAALCLAHGVKELWSADRDFSYFPELRTWNPLVHHR